MSKKFIVSYDLHGVEEKASDHKKVGAIIQKLSSLRQIESVEELDVSTTWHIDTDDTVTRPKLRRAIIQALRLFKGKGSLTFVSITLLVASVTEFRVAKTKL